MEEPQVLARDGLGLGCLQFEWVSAASLAFGSLRGQSEASIEPQEPSLVHGAAFESSFMNSDPSSGEYPNVINTLTLTLRLTLTLTLTTTITLTLNRILIILNPRRSPRASL